MISFSLMLFLFFIEDSIISPLFSKKMVSPKIHCFLSSHLPGIRLESPSPSGDCAIAQGLGMNIREGKTLAGKEVIRDSKVCLRGGWNFRRTSEIWVWNPPEFMGGQLLMIPREWIAA
jgi:hypothetical protein